MPELVWDQTGSRTYETGLDRGVLYLPDGSAVPWNGLTSVIEKFDRDVNPVYYDGIKIQDLITVGAFEASLKAVTYPDEFAEVEGLGYDKRGVFYADQPPQTFGLCYRTNIGNDLDGSEAGYKIHILYNVTAIPSDKTYATISADPSLVEFEWTITAIPEEVPGFRPTAHLVIDTRKVDPWLLEELEEILYGSTLSDASLIPMSELVSWIQNWFRVKITDHGDGTWSADAAREGFIFFSPGDLFEIVGVNAVYINDELFEITDTSNLSEVPDIKINHNYDGTWTATTDHDNLIIYTNEYTVDIRNANIIVIDEHSYQISDTTEND